MSDLISRSELLKEVEKYKFGAISNDAEREYIKKTILDFIICQPTAYDIDKVVEKLESEKRYGSKYDSYYEENLYRGEMFENDVNNKTIDRAIEIVKQGGMADDVCEWKRSGDMARNPHTFIKYNINQFDGLYALDTCQYCRKKIKVVE